MADSFIEVPIVVNAFELADNAIDALSDSWEDWSPNDGDLEVVQIEAIAPMAADAAGVAAVMPAAAFEVILGRLYSVVPQTGTPATATVTFHLIDTTQRTIPEGTEVDIDGFAFSTDNDVTSSGVSTAVVGVPVTANV